MSASPIFQELWAEGWFVGIVGTEEDRITIECRIYSRDYDEETGISDILRVFPSESGCCAACNDKKALSYGIVCPLCGTKTREFFCVAKFHGVFELRSECSAFLLDQPLPSSWGYKDLPADMAAAIAPLITSKNFPKEAEFMRNREQEEARQSFWGSISEQVSAMIDAGDTYGALKLQRAAADKLIGWVNPPVEEEEIPEPNLEDMTPPRYSLIEAADAKQDEEEDNYLPVGSHLLPEDFQSFLRSWNQTIAASTGDWLGEPRQAYKAQNPEQWAQFNMELKRLSRLYAADVAAVKAYQQAQEA